MPATNAESVVHASPNDECGIWGSDLRAVLTLTGSNTDWPLVKRIWAVLATLWSAIAWDETSGFEVNKTPLGLPEQQSLHRAARGRERERKRPRRLPGQGAAARDPSGGARDGDWDDGGGPGTPGPPPLLSMRL